MTIDSPAVPRVLLDASVLRRGHIGTPAKLKTEIDQAGRSQVVAVSRGFTKRPENQSSWQQKQIEMLPTIANLLLEREFEGFISWELSLEYRGVWEEPRVGNIFADVPLKIARVPIYRDRSGTSRFNREELEIHCRRLLRLMPKMAEQYIDEFGELKALDEFEKQSFLDIETLRKICRADKDGRHLRDAYHLWTAERNDIEYFCMIEKKFPNYVRHQQKASQLQVKCQIVTPEELLDRLGVTELQPLPLQDGWFYHWGGGEQEISPPSRNQPRWRSLLQTILGRLAGHARLAP